MPFGRTVLVFSFWAVSLIAIAQPSDGAITRVMEHINDLRQSGCRCDGERMPVVAPLRWDNDLYNVSNHYARYMARHDIFSHVDKEGRTVAERLTAAGYDWYHAGENIAQGFDDYYTVIQAWIESPDHCRMIMHPSMTTFGMSKHGDIWVQTFAQLRTHQRYTTH